jgi:chitinase
MRRRTALVASALSFGCSMGATPAGFAGAIGARIVGYVFAPDEAIRPDQIAAEKLTHVNYAFVELRGGRLVAGGEHDAANLAVLTGLRRTHPRLRVLVSVGGWTGSKGFSEMARTAAGRARFAESATEFVRLHDLDGLDVDWEYPGQPGAGNPHRPGDREAFNLLLADLRAALDRDGSRRGRALLLTIAAGASAEYLAHTEMANAQASLDLVNLMTYDFCVAEAGDKAGHHANLRESPADPGGHSVDKAVRLFLEAGVPAAKLVLGVPFYGRAWTGVEAKAGLYRQGRPVGARFDASYGNLATLAGRDGWVREWDETAQAPSLWNAGRRIFVSYEDPESLRLKCRYVRERGLAGVMFWESHADPKGALLDVLFGELRGSAR